MSKTIDSLEQAIIRRKREILAFEVLTPEEKRMKTEQGLNPHENKRVRARRRALYLERRKKEFDSLPAETREALESFGLSPYQDGQQIRRTGGAFTVK